MVCSNIRLEASKASKRVVQGTQDRTRGVHKMENKVHKRGEPMKVDFNLKGQDRPIYFVVHELLAGKNSFRTYVCYTLDVLF